MASHLVLLDTVYVRVILLQTESLCAINAAVTLFYIFSSIARNICSIELNRGHVQLFGIHVIFLVGPTLPVQHKTCL